MRRFFVIANWKMQVEAEEARELARETVRLWAAQGAANPAVTVAVCPPFASLDEVREEISGTPVSMGGQDCFWESRGAYTGEVSVMSLKDAGCRFCLVGHSERREYLGETDGMVRKKVRALLDTGLIPVVCIGETREERESGRRDAVVIGQLKAILEGNRPIGSQEVIVAYEPRWVIGTGQAVSPEDAASMHQLIYDTLEGMFPSDTVERQFSVIYGGSADAENIGGFLRMPVIDGCLVGKAALSAKGFVRMAEAAADIAKG
ncbi:triose-phosphate isomerase [Candidatus Uhrbacteria bacterium]|nr:triose-phosphate isomerase [Candidatus Uhrbacteria bacterium]